MTSMTDRELLEKAAKAIELPIYGWSESAEAFYCPTHRIETCWWNPLTDDGDALRLAVKLRIHITMNAYGAAASGPNCGTVERDSDVYAATRRAIVRAAAAMNVEKPQV